MLFAGHPLEDNRHDPTSVNTDLFPSRLSHIKMLERRVAPAAIVVWESIVRRAEVCCSNGDGYSFLAPLGIYLVVAHDLVALST